MRLSEYLEKHHESTVQFARRVGLNHSTIYRIATGQSLPKLESLDKIILATGGRVTVNDLYSARTRTRKTPREPNERSIARTGT